MCSGCSSPYRDGNVETSGQSCRSLCVSMFTSLVFAGLSVLTPSLRLFFEDQKNFRCNDSCDVIRLIVRLPKLAYRPKSRSQANSNMPIS